MLFEFRDNQVLAHTSLAHTGIRRLSQVARHRVNNNSTPEAKSLGLPFVLFPRYGLANVQASLKVVMDLLTYCLDG
jgi:hypothetical protein